MTKEQIRQEEKLELYKKALCVFVNWAEECDFGYDNIPDEYEKYKDELEQKKIGYIEGLMYIALREAKNEDCDLFKKWIGNVDKAIDTANN